MTARRVFTAFLMSIGVAAARPAAAQNAALITLAGTDTFCFERYARQGNVITGSWVVMHPTGVYVHEYRIDVGPDGLPVRYRMIYKEPTTTARRDLDSAVVVYTRDTVSYAFVGRDSTITRKVALHEAFPFLGQSMVGLDLAMRRLRAAHAESGVITAAETSNLVTPPRQIAVRFSGDSAFVGAAARISITPEGGFRGLDDGRRVVREAPGLEVERLTQHFVDAFAARARKPE